ncbi:sigma 54-interacting transcriptional regulator [Desulfovibrio litoralis]|uniref:HTH-type transcriptional regulatory protein TyrR n=1 Tax=Desulfovibrio litoralis DSM 11393 TaxID=1121455 RepID=A0A1M7RYY7_9BACT|nr:sigma 54-interacting transcriptional regulator [Desulfovibrio litoralis]SHN51401.1 PAS domain S-box-containing protein [Desulfovibrio litoralis DSM 11393]
MNARDIMQAPLKTLNEKTTMREAVAFFRKENVCGVQVVNKQGVFLGILSRDDVYAALASGRVEIDNDITCNIRYMICSVHPDTSIDSLKKYGSSFLTVIENGQILGGIDLMSIKAITKELTPYEQPPENISSHILQNLPDATFIVDDSWNIKWFNAMAGILCFGNSDFIIGKSLYTLFEESGFTLETEKNDKKAIIIASRDDTRFIIITLPVNNGQKTDHIIFMRNVQYDILNTQEVNKWRILSKERDAIIDSSFDGLFITDDQGRVLRLNSAYERITGITAADVLGKKMSELVSDNTYDESVTMKVLKSKKRETILQKIRGSKSIVVTGNPIFDDNGNIWRVLTNVRDVTELRSLQKELERMAAVQRQYQKEINTLRYSMNATPDIIISSAKMREVYNQAIQLAQVDSSVLITGESGVGKEVVSGIIHQNSHRRNAPFIKISCATIPEQLLESELFGYMPGAFTGALRNGKQGLFELANNGTLLLDEVGELPTTLQVKLLRVLQERVVTPLGGVRSVPVDVRIIAATNQNLEEMIKTKLFRTDLFYRLNVVPLVIPPLRERREDIFDFIYYFLNRYNKKYGFNKHIDPDALSPLISAKWPGNVRQLSNTIERAVVMTNNNIITQEDILKIMHDSQSKEELASFTTPKTLQEIVETAEKTALINALQAHKNTRATAKALGINQSTVVRKAKYYGIPLNTNS